MSITPGVHPSDQVAEVLTTEIRTGRLAVGSKLPTEAALVVIQMAEVRRALEAEVAGLAAARKATAGHMDNAIKRIEPADPAFWQQAGVQLARPLVSGRPLRN